MRFFAVYFLLIFSLTGCVSTNKQAGVGSVLQKPPVLILDIQQPAPQSASIRCGSDNWPDIVDFDAAAMPVTFSGALRCFLKNTGSANMVVKVELLSGDGQDISCEWAYSEGNESQDVKAQPLPCLLNLPAISDETSIAEFMMANAALTVESNRQLSETASQIETTNDLIDSFPAPVQYSNWGNWNNQTNSANRCPTTEEAKVLWEKQNKYLQLAVGVRNSQTSPFVRTGNNLKWKLYNSENPYNTSMTGNPPTDHVHSRIDLYYPLFNNAVTQLSRVDIICGYNTDLNWDKFYIATTSSAKIIQESQWSIPSYRFDSSINTSTIQKLGGYWKKTGERKAQWIGEIVVNWQRKQAKEAKVAVYECYRTHTIHCNF